MGFGAVQKTGEAITKGTEEASSALETAGTVIAIRKTDGKEFIVIYVKPGVGGIPIDAQKTAITFTVEEPSTLATHYVVEKPDAGVSSTTASKCSASDVTTPPSGVTSYTVLACVVHGDTDNLIELGEKWAFVINVTRIYNAPNKFEPYMEFTVEIKPPAGAVLIVHRRLPASITPVMETW